MRYAAILRDSLVETLDKKSMYVLLAVCLLFIATCAGVSFKELDAQSIVRHLTDGLNHVIYVKKRTVWVRSFSAVFDVSQVRQSTTSRPDAPREYEFLLRVTPASEFHKAVLTWDAIQKKRVEGENDPVPGIDHEKVEDPGASLCEEYLKKRFYEHQVFHAELERLPSESNELRYKVKTSHARLGMVEGAYEWSFFGLGHWELPMSSAAFLTIVQVLLSKTLAGTWGVGIAIIFTAGFVPNMLQKGTLDLILCRPVRRPLLLLTKYVGGLFYVILPATVLIGGSWLVLSWRASYWNYGFLMTIVVLAAEFAILYSITVICGVLFRSTIASILLTYAVWFAGFAVSSFPSLCEFFSWTPPDSAMKAVSALHWVLPRTSDLDRVTEHFVNKGNFGADAAMMLASQAELGIDDIHWRALILSSVLFVATMLGLASWIFSRRDY